jgi:hypothetical protein
MEQTLSLWKFVTISDNTQMCLTATEENPNYISISPWQYGAGHGVTTMDKDAAIKFANALLDWAGGGNK